MLLEGSKKRFIKRVQGEPKNRTFAFFGENFFKITYKGYFHAILKKKFRQKTQKFFPHPVLKMCHFSFSITNGTL
jgi:hypothetical protein